MTTEELRAAIESALRRRDHAASVSVLPERQGKYGNADPLALAMVNGGDVTMVRATEVDALRALAIACGLRDDGSDPAEEVERLRDELAEARAALREIAPTCAHGAVATWSVRINERPTMCDACRRDVSVEHEHANALRAAGTR